MPVEKVHFHEVGALDSIADIAGAAVALDLLGVEHFTCRSVPPGSGTVKCAHGLMPVPAPGDGGAAQGRAAGDGARDRRIGHADGGRDPGDRRQRVHRPAGHDDRAHRLRGRPQGLYRAAERAARVRRDERVAAPGETDTVTVLETNLDDVPGEVIGYCFERLFAAGALDVFTAPIQMKKNRPGDAADRDRPTSTGAGAGSDPLPRDGHVRHPPAPGEPEQDGAAEAVTVRDAVGPGPGQARLARRR